MESLDQFADNQEGAINDAANKARQLLMLRPQFDIEAWWHKFRQVSPYARGVSDREFFSAVMGTPFRNTKG